MYCSCSYTGICQIQLIIWPKPDLARFQICQGWNLAQALHRGSRTLRPQDTSAPRHFGTTKSVLKFQTNHQWRCVSSELFWIEVSRLFLDHGTRVEVSRTTFLVSKCLEIGAEVSQSVLTPKCPLTCIGALFGTKLFCRVDVDGVNTNSQLVGDGFVVSSHTRRQSRPSLQFPVLTSDDIIMSLCFKSYKNSRILHNTADSNNALHNPTS